VPTPFQLGMTTPRGGAPRKYNPGDIIRFTYEHQDVDASTGDKFKEVLVLNPWWNNKLHGIDLHRLTPAERRVLEDVLDPEPQRGPSPIKLVNDIRKKMDPLELIKNPVVFYVRFVKPFARGKDIYRQYIPRRMSNVTVVRAAKIGTGKPPVPKPLFGPKRPVEREPITKDTDTKGLTPIDIMKLKNRPLK